MEPAADDKEMREARIRWLRDQGRNSGEPYPGDAGLDGFAAGFNAGRSATGVPLELLTRLQASALPNGSMAMDAMIPAAIWREFVDAHAAALYAAAHS